MSNRGFITIITSLFIIFNTTTASNGEFKTFLSLNNDTKEDSFIELGSSFDGEALGN